MDWYLSKLPNSLFQKDREVFPKTTSDMAQTIRVGLNNIEEAREVRQQLLRDSDGIAKTLTRDSAYTGTTEESEKQMDALEGNIANQLQFLSRLLAEGSNNSNIAGIHQTSEPMRDNSKMDAVILEKEKKEKGKKLEDLTVAEAMKLKDDVDEIYGEGEFYKAAGCDIANILSMINQSQTLSGRVQKVNSTEDQKEEKSFIEALTGAPAMALKPTKIPSVEGGNVCVEIDEMELQKGVEENVYSLIGRLSLGKGDISITTMSVKKKLESSWGFDSFRLAPLGRGYYHVLIDSMEKQSVAMSHGPIMLHLGVFRVSPWVRDFDPFNQKMTHALVWLRIYGLPVEYRRPINLLNVARGAVFPWRIDPLTLNKYNGLYARVQIDVDCSSSLPDKILVKRSGRNFFVRLEYEDLPDFCTSCEVLGRKLSSCRKSEKERHNVWDDEDRVQRKYTTEKGQYVNKRREHCIEQQGVLQNQHAVNIIVEESTGHGQDTQQNGISEQVKLKQATVSSHEQNTQYELNLQNNASEATDNTTTFQQRQGTPAHGEHGALNQDAVTQNAASLSSNRGTKDTGGGSKRQQPAQDSQVLDGTSGMKDTLQQPGHFERVDTPSKNLQGTSAGTINTNEKGNSTRWGDRVEIEGDDMNEDKSEEATSDAREIADPESGGKTKYSGKFQALQGDTSEKESSEDESCDEEPEQRAVDLDKIFWFPEDNAYAHSSGMRYEVATKEYTTWVLDDPDDLRCLHYMSFKGVIKLIRMGTRWKKNNQVLKDKDWDRSKIYTEKSFGYREDLHKLFRDKIESNNKKADA